MALSEALLPEFDQEMANTRKTLERIPDDKLGWKPHEKSMPLGHLAVHLATIPTYAVETVQRDSLDLSAPGAPRPPAQPKSRQEILEQFDRNRAAARAAIASASDEALRKPWTLWFGGKAVFTLPRIAVLRAMVLSHIIHHRAQLGVYLRLNDIPVPAIYGPSADES